MRILRSTTGLTIVLLISATLAGCAPPSRHVIPTAEPSVKPVFKSDAEALAAAEKAFKGYQTASDAIGADGGSGVSRLAEWVSPTWLKHEVADAAALRKSARHTTGSSSYSSSTLQQVINGGNHVVRVVVYLCDDVGKVQVINAKGENVTPDNRQLLPLELEFVSAEPGSATLELDRSTPWGGQDFCA
jgi:hypothetical protein